MYVCCSLYVYCKQPLKYVHYIRLRESTKANLQPEQQHQKQQQQQEHQQSSTTGISIVDMEPEAVSSLNSIIIL